MKDKILLVGANGNMGSNHHRVLKELGKENKFDLKTCDISGGADYKDYTEAYEEFKPNKVVIATPTSSHSELLQYFNNKVYSIFIEKPLVDDDSEDYYLITKTKIMVGHIERYNSMIRKVKELLDGKSITHIFCMRCGLPTYINDILVKDKNVDKDLVIHDIDVAQYLTTHLKLLNKVRYTKSTTFTKMIEDNQADIVTEINGVKCFFHADKTSPSKVRTIKILGPEYIIEGDYIEQTLLLNGKEVKVEKKEPLKVELEMFIKDTFKKPALVDAVNNLKILKGKHITYI